MAEVIVRPGAQADIRAVALWYESRREGLGSEFILHFDTLVECIAQNPLRSGVRRALQRFPYAIYFVVVARPVVIAVLHQRRHPDTWKGRL